VSKRGSSVRMTLVPRMLIDTSVGKAVLQGGKEAGAGCQTPVSE
jgi:hypothetical protein